MSLADLTEYFDVIALSPVDWPVTCNLTLPNASALDRWKNWPTAALPSSGRAASGKGTDDQAALASGLGEAIEIASLCRWGDEETATTTSEKLSGEVWNAELLDGFSLGQRASRDAWNAQLHGTDWIPQKQVLKESEWVMAQGLNGMTVWVPAEAVFLGLREAGDPQAQIIADTNGCAAGATDRAAQSAALFELIERDATGRWWYGCRESHQLSEDWLCNGCGRLLEACTAAGLPAMLFDITSDIGVPVVAAASRTNGGPLSLGFAAAPTYADAALKALTEMAQMALVFRGGDGRARPGMEQWSMEVGFDTPPFSLSEAPASHSPEAPPTIGSRLQENGIRVAFCCQTRPELAVPVWRAISPDLCHWKPRFGRPRLLAEDTGKPHTKKRDLNPVLLRI